MPQRSKKNCACPGCPNTTLTRWCESHAKNKHVARSYDDRRGSSSARGYDATWKRTRLIALRRDNYLCAHCLLEGRPVQATDVDHIVTIADAPELRLDLENLQCLCKKHHDQKTYQENGAFGRSPKDSSLRSSNPSKTSA